MREMSSFRVAGGDRPTNIMNLEGLNALNWSKHLSGAFRFICLCYLVFSLSPLEFGVVTWRFRRLGYSLRRRALQHATWNSNSRSPNIDLWEYGLAPDRYYFIIHRLKYLMQRKLDCPKRTHLARDLENRRPGYNLGHNPIQIRSLEMQTELVLQHPPSSDCTTGRT